MSDKKTNSSVLVIGGGIMGLGSAFHLAKDGLNVTIIEQNSEVAKVSLMHRVA